MKHAIYSFTLVTMLLFLGSCRGEEQISREYLCRFSFDAVLHSTSKIVTAVNAQGYFVWIEMSKQDGVMHVKVHPADNSGDEDIALTTAAENYISYELGAYNGIFLGRTNFSGLAAYDRQCPNCLHEYNTFTFPLTWTSKPMEVKCAKCNRTYSLETGASPQGGRRLMQYGVRETRNEFNILQQVTVMN